MYESKLTAWWKQIGLQRSTVYAKLQTWKTLSNDWPSCTFFLTIIYFITWLSLFCPCDWSICSLYNFLYRPNCQEQNPHFAALNLKVKERHLSTLRNWMLTLSFNILICVYLWRKAFKKLNHNLITEENSRQCLKILSQYTVKKTKVDWLKGKQAIPSTNTCMITNIPANIPAPDHLDKLLCHLQCFSQRPTKER